MGDRLLRREIKRSSRALTLDVARTDLSLIGRHIHGTQIATLLVYAGTL